MDNNKILLTNLYSETKDTLNYRKFLTNQTPNNDRLDKNINFFMYNGKAKPNKETLAEILKHWKNNFYKLEENHDYIQWLFPIETQGMNKDSQPLQFHEYYFFKQFPIKGTLLKSFRMMLRFYGSDLESYQSTKVVKTLRYKLRYNNLKNRPHNYLRITRILKCLGHF